MKSIPVVLCERRRYRKPPDWFVFYCPYCLCEHTHSAEEGYRLAHCHNPNSPYYRRSYILQEQP